MADRYEAQRSYLRQVDPALARVIDERPGFDPRQWLAPLLPTMDAFGVLLFAIAGQQVSVRSRWAITRRLEALFGGHLPSPQELLAADPETVRGAGLSQRQLQAMRSLATQFVKGELSADAFRDAPDEEIEAKLTAIPGIGPWTAQSFLLIVLDRPDVFPADDLALRRAAERLYGLDHLPAEQEMLHIAERWRPYRSLAAFYLVQSEGAGNDTGSGARGGLSLSKGQLSGQELRTPEAK